MSNADDNASLATKEFGGDSELSDNSLGFIEKSAAKLKKMFSFKSNSLEEDVAELINEHDPDGTLVGTEERVIVHNLMGLSERTVSDVMTQRTDIVYIDYSVSLEELQKIVIETEHTRFPVCKNSLDNICGFIHIKDLIQVLSTRKDFQMDSIIREALYVPPSMKVVDLLVRMRNQRIHIAVVLDEYGGTEGLLTMEDIMEEIVGDIADEHDDIEEPDFIKLDENNYQVKARMEVRKLEEHMNVMFKTGDEDEDFDTVGGLIFFMLGRIPGKGEVIEHSSGIIFEVTDADMRKIKKLIVKRPT